MKIAAAINNGIGCPKSPIILRVKGEAKPKSRLPRAHMPYGMPSMQTCNSAAAMVVEKNLPSPVQTAFLAKLAGVDPLVAVAEIEAEKKPTSASLWAAIGVKIGGDEGI